MTRSYTEPLLFDGNDITDIDGWTTTKVDDYSYAERDVNIYSLAYEDKASTTAAFFNSRRIVIEGIIALSDRSLLDAQLSELKRITIGVNKTMILPAENTTRKFNDCTLQNLTVDDVGGGYARIGMQFATTDPFSYETTSTELLNELNETSGNVSYPVVFDGTAKQLPTITYTVDSVTDATSSQVVFTDPASGVSITVERDWTAGEVLVIDCENKTVTVDGTATDYTGNFLEFDVTTSYINYTDEFTARQVDINVTYNKRYY